MCIRDSYDAYRANAAELLEVNPLALTTEGKLYALDCKLVLDDSARKQHEGLFARVEAALGEQGTELAVSYTHLWASPRPLLPWMYPSEPPDPAGIVGCLNAPSLR